MGKKEFTARTVGSRLIVKPNDKVTKTEGGVLLPDQGVRFPNRGKVMSVGSGYMAADGVRVPVECKVGDTVIFLQNAGDLVKIDDEEYIVMAEEEVLVIL